jgi:hypothetical protein
METRKMPFLEELLLPKVPRFSVIDKTMGGTFGVPNGAAMANMQMDASIMDDIESDWLSLAKATEQYIFKVSDFDDFYDIPLIHSRNLEKHLVRYFVSYTMFFFNLYGSYKHIYNRLLFLCKKYSLYTMDLNFKAPKENSDIKAIRTIRNKAIAHYGERNMFANNPTEDSYLTVGATYFSSGFIYPLSSKNKSLEDLQMFALGVSGTDPCNGTYYNFSNTPINTFPLLSNACRKHIIIWDRFVIDYFTAIKSNLPQDTPTLNFIIK